MNLISVCIPTYEMRGHGHVFLRQSLDMLACQTFDDFEVIISDHSQNNLIQELCSEYLGRLSIKYYKNNNNRGSISANTNNAMANASGKLIKILFQDDFLFNENSLSEIAQNFDLQHDQWMITASESSVDGVHFFRPFYPTYNKKIYRGNNTISSPSVLTIKNESPLLFDKKLIWLMDCDYYYRCYLTFGAPKILNTITVVNRVGKHQVSSAIVNLWLKIKERIYAVKKYKKL